MKTIHNLIFILLFMVLFPMTIAMAQEDSDDEDEDLEKIVVTGSRIARTDIEGPQPVTIISSEDIQRGGFTNAFEALSSLTQFNGSIQDDQFAGGFTQAANALDLRALGPGRTLTLLNGRRIAEYPLPFNGQSNIVNLANVPSVMIERIEVLAAGASAIYGSDAVAGVVNIILKENVDETTVSLRYGDTSDGGGESLRFQLSGGFTPGKLKINYGLEYFDRDPIWGYQRDFQDSANDDPTTSGIPFIDDPVNGVVNSRSFLILDIFDGNGDGLSYIDPGAEACGPLAHLERGTIAYSQRPGRGFYCGTPANVAAFTIRNAKEQISFVTNFSYELANDHEIFGLLNYIDVETRYDTGTRFWQYDLDGPAGGGVFINANSPDDFDIGGGTELWQRIFTHEEVGKDNNGYVQDEESIDFTLGLRGPIFDTWNYEFNWTHSEYDTQRLRRLIIGQAAEDFFLGPAIGEIDLGFGAPFEIFEADPARLYTPLTPAEYNSISGIDNTTADSSSDTIQLIMTGDLFEMPAGYVGFAGILEAGSQDYDIQLDPRLLDGTFFGFTGSGGGGERDRYAAGAEMVIPLFEQLTATVAGRFDQYDDVTEVDSAFTYNLGLEWRPFDSLLVRGSASTSFRAPDMHFVFADPNGFFTFVQDDYLCRRDEPGVSFPDCTNGRVNIEGTRSGNLALEEEEGESYTIGFVWNILDGMSLAVDYYDIELDNAVNDLSLSNLIETEADCRLGVTQGGQSVDINSAECQDALARITRFPVLPNNNPLSEGIDIIATQPLNTAFLKTTGIDANFRYAFATESFGLFTFDASYNHVLKAESIEFEGDEVNNDRGDLQIFDFRSRARAGVSWDINNWNATLLGIWTGSIPNWAETGRCCEHTTYNGSVQYTFDNSLKVGLYVQNLTNEAPPRDETFFTYPYYSDSNFNPYGREYFAQVDYSF